jgi:predicted MFS family arabinose efflux permease
VTEARLPRWAIAATLGGFLFGYNAGVIAGALLPIRSEFGLSNVDQGILVSLLPFGAALGSLLNGRLAEQLGRRGTLLLDAALFLVASALAAAAPNFAVLVVARAIAGLAVGSASSTVPLYLAEVCPPNLRGRVVTANQIMITLGIVSAYAIDLAFAASGSWRAMFLAGLIPAAALAVGMLKAPESQASLEGRASAPSGTFRNLLEHRARPALVIGTLLALVQQFSGINAVIYYAPTIMERTGLNASDSILYSVIVGGINVAATVVAFPLIDRIGRRPLLLASLGGMLVSLVLLGLTFEVRSFSGSGLTLVCLLAFIAFFAVGIGPVFWILIAEIFPAESRTAGAALAAAVAWVANFAIGLVFLPVAQAIGIGPTFWVFAAVCGLGGLFVFRYVPETKQRPLAEISAELAGRWRWETGRSRPRSARPT